MVLEDLPVRRHEQRPRAARRIDHPQPCHRVCVAPIHVLPSRLRQGESGEERRCGDAGIEGGQQLALGDESVEYPPRQIVPPDRAHPQQRGRSPLALV